MAKKTVISVLGKFHAHRLAEELQRRSKLKKLNISYHKEIPYIRKELKNQYRSLYFLRRALEKVFGRTPFEEVSVLFDNLISTKIKDQICNEDVFYGWSGHCLKSIKAARNQGATTIVERSNAHILDQISLVNEEMNKFGINKNVGVFELKDRMIEEYKLSDKIMVNSTFSEKTFLRRGYSSDKIINIPLGTPWRNREVVKSEAENELRLIYVGGDPIRKGLYYLLEAWNEIEIQNKKLFIVGPVPKKFGHLIDETIVSKSSMPQEHLFSLYEDSSALCLPSIEDGFGMVVPEAMMHGLPVIVSTNVGASDIVDDGVNGYKVEPRNSKDIAKAVGKMFDDKTHATEMSNNARNKAEQYTWRSYGRKISRLIDNIT